MLALRRIGGSCSDLPVSTLERLIIWATGLEPSTSKMPHAYLPVPFV